MEEFNHFFNRKVFTYNESFNKNIFNGVWNRILLELEQIRAHSHFFQNVLSAGLVLLHHYKINPSLISSHKGFVINTGSIPINVQFISLVAGGY